MKRVNFNPDLELKKTRIMEQFNHDDGPHPSVGTSVNAPTVATDDLPGTTGDELVTRVIDALKTVYDPEIPVNIYDLGLIYKVDIHRAFADIDMTLTAPGCPVAATFPGMVERTVALVPGIEGAAVELVWDPPWTPELISEAARLELGLI